MSDIDRAVEIERLASLESIDYEIARVEAAKLLGVRAHVLDRAVAKKRRALGLDTRQGDDGQGRAVKIVDVLPWPEPVGGDRIATTLAAVLKTYAVLPDPAADTIALWILHTWLANEFMISPRLAVVSPTKGCGKTTVLRLLNKIVRRPKRAGSISPPALFRAVEQFQPTILLDETEKYIEYGSDLHALLNEGHCKGGTVLRVLGEKLELREFAIFGPVAYARNGRVPEDLEQRSIIVEMQRRRADEALVELRDDRCEHLQQVARMCARWADDTTGTVADCDPDMGGLINRNADNWRCLFTIADMIGADWPDRIREAATALTPSDSEAIGPMLLGDIRWVFDGKPEECEGKVVIEYEPVDKMSSADLADHLAAIEGRPWAEWKSSKNASPKPISQSQLARLLKDFHIRPDNIYPGGGKANAKRPKGYYRHRFTEAFERYLGPQGVNDPLHRYTPTATGTSSNSEPLHAHNGVADEKCAKPLRHNECSGVADQNGDNGLARANGEPWPRVCDHCGGPERPGSPIQECWVAGEQYWLHRGACQHGFGQDDDLTIPASLRRVP
jgi:hypothetical protein